MKNLILIITVIALPIITCQSCACSPESCAQKDAEALNEATRNNDKRAIDKAREKAYKHMDRYYYRGAEEYYRYMSVFSEEYVVY